MPTETQEYTESSGSPPEVFGNLSLRSGRVLSLPALAGLLSRKKKKSQHISNNTVAISVFLNPTTIQFGATVHHGNTNWPESLTLGQWTCSGASDIITVKGSIESVLLLLWQRDLKSTGKKTQA